MLIHQNLFFCLLLTVSSQTVNALGITEDTIKVSEHTLRVVEESKQLRELLPGFVQEASQAIASHDGALPAKYTIQIAKTLNDARVHRKALFEQALKNRSALYRTDKNFPAQQRLQSLIIGMSAAVTLFDNNRAMRLAFEDHSLLRSKLNEGYPEFGVEKNFYNNSMQQAGNQEYRKTMEDAIRYFTDNKNVIQNELQHSPAAIQKLYKHIADSPSLNGLEGSNVFKEIVVLPFTVTKAGFKLTRTGLRSLKFTTSKIAGNTMGLMRWRSGKLKRDKVILQAMLEHLEPGDILLEKTAGALTDKTIPGHFGHVAIYTGTYEQLQTSGVFESPNGKQYQKQIKDGRTVVEALRNGVQIDRLQDFMNVDDVAILRPKYLSQQDRLEAVKLALGNIGKKYDFNFDVNTTETIVCSELAYLTYPQIDFVTKRVLSSFTVSPDDIAQQAGARDQDPLQVVLFAHDGKLVLDHQRQADGLALYDKLVKGISETTGQTQAPQESYFKGFIQNSN